MLDSRDAGAAVKFFAIEDGDHFDILAPLNRYLGARIVGPWSSGPVQLTDADVAAAFRAK